LSKFTTEKTAIENELEEVHEEMDSNGHQSTGIGKLSTKLSAELKQANDRITVLENQSTSFAKESNTQDTSAAKLIAAQTFATLATSMRNVETQLAA
jgi:hypothetical protein